VSGKVNIAALAGLALLAWSPASLAQTQAPAQAAQPQQAQAAAGRAILGEWSFLCTGAQRVGFAEDPGGALKRYYIREGLYRADEEAITAYGEDANFIKMKFASGEELTYKRSPEGIREWFRQLPDKDPMTRNGKTELPVVKTQIDTVIFQRCK